MRVMLLANQCDACGHQWLGLATAKRCASRRCRKTTWNRSGKVETQLTLRPLPPRRSATLVDLPPLEEGS